MNQIPEDFRWDCCIYALNCEITHLLNALMPLSLSEIEQLSVKLQTFPTLLATNISYKNRLDIEKKIEHLPIKIFWSPTSKFSEYHYQYAVQKFNLDQPFFSPKSISAKFKESFLNEVEQFEKFYSLSDFSLDHISEVSLLGLKNSLNEQSIFNQNEIETSISTIQDALTEVLNSILKTSVKIIAFQIEFINQSKYIEVKSDEHVNLMLPNALSSDFHIILPDNLVRVFYSKIVPIDKKKMQDRLNPDIYQESIFEMKNYLYMIINQWAQLKELSDIICIEHLNSFNQENKDLHLPIQNHSSGTGFLIKFKIDVTGLPRHIMSLFITTELIDTILNKRSKNT